MQVTSINAYRSFKSSGDKIDHERKVLAALDFIREGTFQEIADRCGLSYHQVGRRVSELVESGQVYDTGKKGKSPSGRPAIIWAKVKEAA